MPSEPPNQGADDPGFDDGDGGGGTGGVVVAGETYGAAEDRFQVLFLGPADEHGRVGVLDHARGRRKGAGDADADAAGLAGALLQGSDQVGDDG